MTLILQSRTFEEKQSGSDSTDAQAAESPLILNHLTEDLI
jgi:hypothetical protein